MRNIDHELKNSSWNHRDEGRAGVNMAELGRDCDPIEDVLDTMGQVHMDNYLIHLCSWSDVVKNDMRKTLNRDDLFINQTLHAMLTGALDSNGRYSYGAEQKGQKSSETFSMNYVRVQCLLSEWLCIYRAVNVYLETLSDAKEAVDPGEVDFDSFSFKSG